MNITFKQLKCFVTVAHCRNFAEASHQLYLTQPALSTAIKNLEVSLGGQLFDRNTRSSTLTPEGREFLPNAERLLLEWEQSIGDVRDLFTLRKGRLTVAAMPTFAGNVLPEILRHFHQQYPDINVTVQDIVAETLVDAVYSGDIEFGVSFDPGPIADITFTPLCKDDFVVVCCADDKLAKRTTASWSDLNDRSYITLQKPSAIRQQVEEAFHHKDITLTPTFEAHQIVVVGRMVAQGLGVSIMPEISAGQMREMGAVCIPLKPRIRRNIGIIQLQKRTLSTTSQAMVDCIKTFYRKK